MSIPLVVQVCDLLLGPPGRQRMRTAQTLLMVAVFLALTVLLLAEVHLGLVVATDAAWVIGIWLPGSLLFYAIVRLGWNQRFPDPSLITPQVAFAITGNVATYGISGATRGALLTCCAVVLMFTMFGAKPSSTRRLALFGFCLFVAEMTWKSLSDPHPYTAAVEITHGAVLAVMLGCVSLLAGRMGAMRSRLWSQKRELEQALQQVNRLATYDELTGLVNRRHMNELLRAEQARQQRGAVCMRIAVLDIDLFKRINDNHGHHVGDQVLQTFAESCRHVLRSSDVMARWGGEEFLLMLPGTPPDYAALILQRLRTQLSHASFEHIAPGLKVTFSAGMSACDGDEPLAACIERADQAMYRAKTGGRDCVVMA